MPVASVEPARATLVTGDAQIKPSYHLLELTPDLVPLFESRATANLPDGLDVKRKNDDAVEERKTRQR
jgi:hypothetical protein